MLCHLSPQTSGAYDGSPFIPVGQGFRKGWAGGPGPGSFIGLQLGGGKEVAQSPDISISSRGLPWAPLGTEGQSSQATSMAAQSSKWVSPESQVQEAFCGLASSPRMSLLPTRSHLSMGNVRVTFTSSGACGMRDNASANMGRFTFAHVGTGHEQTNCPIM